MSKDNARITDQSSKVNLTRMIITAVICVAAIVALTFTGRMVFGQDGISSAEAAETTSASGSGSSDSSGYCISPDKVSINVTGSDSVTTVPDKADTRVSVLATAATADDASTQASTTATAVKDAMVAAGLTEDMIQTSSVSVSPVYSWDDKGVRTLNGYDATVYFDVKGMDISSVSAVLSGALDAGATSVDSLTYYTSQYDDLYNEALVKSVAQAQKKAETLAGAAGIGNISIASIYESYNNQAYRYIDTSNMTSEAMADSASGASKAIDAGSISAGTIEIDAQVTLTYVAR